VKPFNLVVAGNRGALDRDSVDRNPIRQQQLQHVFVTGITTVFASIADDENNLAARLFAFVQVERRRQNGIIEDVGFLFWSVDNGGTRLFWDPWDRW
jgi:hypothetical protein